MAADVETLRKEVTERKGAMEEEKNFGEARRMEQLKGNLNAGQQHYCNSHSNYGAQVNWSPFNSILCSQSLHKPHNTAAACITIDLHTYY